MQVVRDIFPYFLAKQIDLLDTVFFVLRKKDNQVTFLHVYHHSIMVTWAWLYYVYEPSDHFVVVGLINSFVHVLMYAYYGLASLGPRFAKFVWWKKHLTKVQLVSKELLYLFLLYSIYILLHDKSITFYCEFQFCKLLIAILSKELLNILTCTYTTCFLKFKMW